MNQLERLFLKGVGRAHGTFSRFLFCFVLRESTHLSAQGEQRDGEKEPQVDFMPISKPDKGISLITLRS